MTEDAASARPEPGGAPRSGGPGELGPERLSAGPSQPEPGAGPGRATARRSAWRRLVGVAAFLGPGLVAANAGNDAGGIVTYAAAGAQFGYRTLFFMVLVTVAYVVVQEMTARLATFTGKGLAALIREEFSIRLTGFAMVCLTIANLGLVVTEFAGIAAAFALFGVGRYISIPLAAVLIFLLVVFGSYRYAERVFLVLSVAFLAYIPAAVLGHPDWGALASNLVLPHFLFSRSFLFLGVALIGTTITPYIQLYEAGAVVDRGVGPEDYRLQRIDAITGAVFSDLISVFIIVATAAALANHPEVLTSAAQAAEALRPVAGRGAVVLFGIGLLGASALAAAVVPLSTAYAVGEAIGVERSVSARFREAPVFLGVFTAQLALGVLVVLVPGNLISLIVNAQILEGVITPIILAFILVLANRRRLLGDAVNGPTFAKVAFICVVAVAILSGVVVVQSAAGLF